MPVHCEMDRNEAVVEGDAPAEESNQHYFIQDYPISSFTPVNPKQPPNKCINSLEVHYSHPVDATPRDSSLEVPEKKGRKRIAARANISRAHSLGIVWQFDDEGDQEQPAQHDRHLHKRGKRAPTKRAQSKKVQSPSQILEAEEGTQVYEPTFSQHQATTSVVTYAESKTRSENKKDRLPPFKSLTVTKPKPSAEKEASDDSMLAALSVNNQLGWTTTTEAVRLAKTTLDKLAAFRFNASPQAVPQELKKQVVPYASSRSSPDQSGYTAEIGTTPSGYGLSSGDTFFEEAYWDAISVQPSLHDTGPSGPLDSVLTTNQNFDVQNVKEISDIVSVADNSNFISIHVPTEFVANAARFHKQSDINLSQSKFGYGSPHSTSKEAKALADFMDEMDKHQEHPQPIFRGSSKLETAQSEGASAQIYDDQALGHVILSVDGVSGSSRDDLGIPQSAGSSDACDHTMRPSVDVQVHRSDDDENGEIIGHNVSEPVELDEFDDGVNDSDLLEAASDAVFPATQICSLPNMQELRSHSRKHSSSVVKAQRTALKTPDRGSANFKVIIPRTTSAIEASCVDDEFGMGFEDEDILIEMAEQSAVEPSIREPRAPSDNPETTASAEIYDPSLQFSPIKPQTPPVSPSKLRGDFYSDNNGETQPPDRDSLPMTYDEDWSFVRQSDTDIEVILETEEAFRYAARSPPPRKISGYFEPQSPYDANESVQDYLDDSHEYLPLNPFVRPEFPTLTPDRCPIIGVSAQSFLRTCFRIAEMFREGARCNAVNQDAIIELYAKVNFSSREPRTSKQIFQFADLFYPNKAPIANGVLMNYKTTGLAESESKPFLERGGKMARCLGRLERDRQTSSGWLLHIITVRETDWEEIRWTKRIVNAGGVKSERAST